MMNEFKNDLAHVYCKNLSPPKKVQLSSLLMRSMIVLTPNLMKMLQSINLMKR